jgi:Zn-dependent metalloprotease
MMKRVLPLVLALAAAALYFPRLSAQRPVFTTGTAAELVRARSIGLDRLRVVAMQKGIDDANDLVVSNAHVDRLSMAHVRVQQRFQGVPVFGGEAIAHLNSDGSAFAETDDLIAAISVSSTPTFTADQAIDVAVADYGCRTCLTKPPTAGLWIVRDATGVDHLTYRVQMTRIDGTDQTALPVRFVDAHGGYVVLAFDKPADRDREFPL